MYIYTITTYAVSVCVGLKFVHTCTGPSAGIAVQASAVYTVDIHGALCTDPMRLSVKVVVRRMEALHRQQKSLALLHWLSLGILPK